MSGLAAKYSLPSRPYSSPVNATNTTERAGLGRTAPKARASSIRAAVPLALSTAPLKIVSPLPAGALPRWSQCAVKITYSSGRDLPSRTPTTLLDVVRRISLLTRVDAVSGMANGLKPRRAALALTVS